MTKWVKLKYGANILRVQENDVCLTFEMRLSFKSLFFMKENYHIVWWNEMKILLLQKKQLYNVTVHQKNKI